MGASMANGFSPTQAIGVIPVQAGTQTLMVLRLLPWAPACAGVTETGQRAG